MPVIDTLILEDTPERTVTWERYTDADGNITGEGTRVDYKAGTPQANENAQRETLLSLRAQLRTAITADRALRDRATAARQAIPAANASNAVLIAGLRTAQLEALAIEQDSADARVALDRAVLNITRFLLGDFSSAPE